MADDMHIHYTELKVAMKGRVKELWGVCTTNTVRVE